ncbi:hypothetical protein ACX5K5_07215 [Glutamicibacter bergerei]|uniref:Uncharacterized protein n=2 Tax=Glutamicibacter TaxID=1742989 RepID=A0ABV9MRE8_9MICC|nr:hypothetical protein [Glutamicibacter ardleyensis]GGJ61238.1 hypothetical protein GCM10007173_19980 [Glutamicibacter ardleyensis]
MTERANYGNSSGPTDEPEEKNVVHRGPISDPDQDGESTAEEAEDPNRFDAG